jgi:hypothetical protein
LAQQFLTALWPGRLEGANIQLWEMRSKKTYSFDGANKAAAHAVAAGAETDVYIAAGLAPKGPSVSLKRVRAEQVIAIPGVWADLDVVGGPEQKTNAAPDRDAAISLADSILEPTVLVNSGYGIQAWWLFDEPLRVDEETAPLVRAFQDALRAEARERGFSIDYTHDMSRLMRVPGTFNHKGGTRKPVELLSYEGKHYEYVQIREVIHGFMASARDAQVSKFQTLRGDNLSIQVHAAAQPPFQRFKELESVEPRFTAAWERRQDKRVREKTHSEWELTLGNYMAMAGWSDQEMCDTLVAFREKYEPGDPRGKNRPARLRQTIAKAKYGREREEELHEDERRREEAGEELELMAQIGPSADTKERKLHLFNELLGGPPIMGLIQDSRDPRNVRYRLVMEDRSEVPLGGIEDLLRLERFRASFAVATSFIVPQLKQEKWYKVVQVLLTTAEVNEEDSREEVALGWVEDYLERRLSNDRDGACQAKDPFSHNGFVHVYATEFHAFLSKRGLRIDLPDLKQHLKAAGFQRYTVNYSTREGGKSSRSYYRIDQALLLAPEAAA